MIQKNILIIKKLIDDAIQPVCCKLFPKELIAGV
jgi:hypothetical protein